MRSFFSDSRTCADDDDDLPRQFFLRRHPFQLRLFEQPVFDVERLLLRQRDVLIHRLRPAHDLDGAVVKFRRDTRFGFVLAPRNHAQARNQNDRRVRVAHRRRAGVLALLVIRQVVLAILHETVSQFAFQGRGVLGLRIPRDVERLDFCAEKMVGAARAEFGQTRRVLGIHEAQNLFIVLHRRDETLLLRNLAAQPRQNRGKNFQALFGCERLMPGTAKRLRVAALGLILRLDKLRRLLDERQRAQITFLVVVRPRDETVLAHHDAGGPGIFLHDLLHREAKLKAGPHPLHIIHRAAKNFLRELFAIRRGRNRDDCVRVHVVHELRRNKTVQRRVNGRGARIQVERRVVVGGDHVVLGLRLEALVLARRVGFLQSEQLGLVERGKIFAPARAQVAARTLDPQHFDVFARERVVLRNLG